MRTQNSNAENLIDKFFPVLDKGFVALKDFMGSDDSIVQAARTSYGKGTKTVSDDRTLIRYLMRNKHTTPFESVEFNFMLQIPMDAWRQMVRHRTASISEYSTRYSEAIDLRQETPADKWRLQSTSNKQGSSGYLTKESQVPDGYKGVDVYDLWAEGNPGKWLSYREAQFHKEAMKVYEERLAFGVAKEVARKDLPLSTYTRAYWKIDLHNLLHFLRLRCDSHAQLEIRSYANILAGLVKEYCPIAFEAWYDYSFCASNWTRLDKIMHEWYYSRGGQFSGKFELDHDMESMIREKAESIGMSKRELEEFWQKLQVPSAQDFTLDINSAKPVEYFENLEKTT